MTEFALVIDPKTVLWSGELPRGTTAVYIEFLFPDCADPGCECKGFNPKKPGAKLCQCGHEKHGIWKRSFNAGSRPKKDAIEMIERNLRNSPHLCKCASYRVVPAEDEDNQEDTNSDMATKKKKSTAKKSGAGDSSPAAAKELVAGRFRGGSINAAVYELLADGKARTLADIAKGAKAGSLRNLEHGKIPFIRKHGKSTGTYDIVKTGDKYQMTFGKSSAPKTAPKTDAPKTDDKKPKANGHAPAPAKKAAGKKSAGTKPAPEPPESDDDGLDDMSIDE